MTIRRQPADFSVVERLSPSFRSRLTATWSREATHAVFELTKESLTTPEAIQSFAKSLGLRHAEIGYAGLKDRHAHTIQHVSFVVGKAERAASMPREARGRTWSTRQIAWSPAEVTAESIDGNGFTIVVRGLARESCDEMDRRAALLTLEQKAQPHKPSLLVVNYFGDQRFGSARHGQGWVARALIAGDFDAALRLTIGTPARKDTGRTRAFTRLCAEKWGEWKALASQLPPCPERKPIEALAAGKEARDAFTQLPYFLQSLCVEAYQSFLWNETVRRYAAALAPNPLRSPDTFGEMVFPTAAAASPDIHDLEVPLLAASTQMRQPWAGAAKEALAAEGITKEELRIPGVRRPFFGEASRRLFIRAERFLAGEPEPDELDKRPNRLKRTLAFDLPRGAYATVVLRALGQ